MMGFEAKTIGKQARGVAPDPTRGRSPGPPSLKKGFQKALGLLRLSAWKAMPVALAFLLLALTSAQADTVAAADRGVSDQQRQDIIAVVRQALKSDPSILREAIAVLQADDARIQEASTRAGIASLSTTLTRTPGDPVAGNPDGDVTIVEFYDVRCPYCKRMLPVAAELLRSDKKIRIVYKDIPVLGPASVVAARAVLAAQRQNAYLPMREALMTGNPNIDKDVVKAAAERLNLDWTRLQRDMADPVIQSRIDANLRVAHTLQIQGTPAYIIGGQLLPGAMELAEMQEAVALARKP